MADSSSSSSGATSNVSDKQENTPTYFVPPSFFKLCGQSKGEGCKSWLFRCLKCPGIRKPLSANYKSRYNLKLHIKTVHPILLKQYDDECQANDKRKSIKQTGENSAQVGDKKLLQPNINDFLGHKKLTQKDLDTHISNYLMSCVLPFNHVESSGFETFVKHLCPQLEIKTRKSYVERTQEAGRKLRQALVQEFAATEKVIIILPRYRLAINIFN